MSSLSKESWGVLGLLGTSVSSLGLHSFPSASSAGKGAVLLPVSGCLGDKVPVSVGISLFQLCLLTAFLP